ncbi:uncharacterized protein LOC133896805 [Phragmites australis]|uniref:uncharacterized protein LOC133896805 n=1 Tax=Phragmites australis TaxID=29695 RepID=UPI002D77601E|nr:uncharacterized protein LOC133896805 [Phragmites australis]
MGAYISEGAGPWGVPTTCSSVSVPVRGFHDGMEPARDHERLISDGLLLEWPPTGDCAACKRGGWECRFVQRSFQCACPDGLPCSSTLRGVASTARKIIIGMPKSFSTH